MLGRHTIKTWSSTQTSIALSSGEAEFHEVVKAAGMGQDTNHYSTTWGYRYLYVYGPIPPQP